VVERARLLHWLAVRRVPVVHAVIGEKRQVGAVGWEVLDVTARHGTDSDPNNSSIVLRLTLPGARVLMAGDLESGPQRELLDRGVDLRADVLKVPHHGSRKQDPGYRSAAKRGQPLDRGVPSNQCLRHASSWDLAGMSLVVFFAALAVVVGVYLLWYAAQAATRPQGAGRGGSHACGRPTTGRSRRALRARPSEALRLRRRRAPDGPGGLRQRRAGR